MIFVNIEAYDAESLRKLVRLLEYENRLLKDKLKKENIPYDEVNPFEDTIDNVEEYDPDQGERIVNPPFITEEMATDFANTDNEWHKEVDALRKMCEINGIKPLVERSRSGKGAHVWIFFKKAIPASVARNFGFLLLDKGSASINLKSFHYYDRMYPSQDVASSIGNLIALPLQGQALKNGNSAFVDENWNAYPNQWDILLK